MLKPTKTRTLTFDDKIEKIELFGDLFQTILGNQPQLTEATKFIHFHPRLSNQRLQTFGIEIASYKRMLGEVLILLRRKYVGQKSQATANYKMNKITFDPNRKSLSVFPAELSECAEQGAFGLLHNN